jgi:hypothetical protein
MLALDVEPEELHVAEDIGALALGSIGGAGGIDTMGDAALLERPRQSADPRDGSDAHALELRRGRELLELPLLDRQLICIDELEIAIDAASGD